jgi:enoyl-CoA hydratase/carnithine racemase
MKNVSYEKKGKIAYITLDRPDKLNSITAEMLKQLQEIWESFRDDEESLVAILSGAGKAFCAGVAANELATGKWSISQSQTMGDRPAGPVKHKIWKPIIAALHGHVIGGGFWLALECDLRIAADNTQFCLPEARVGIPTSFAAFLPDFLPRGIAAELLFTGDRMNVQRAYQLGLVNRVVPLDDLMKEATVLAEHILENAPLSVQAVKKVMVRSKGLDYQSALNLTDDIYAAVYESEDAKEGKKAFMEKRKPVWKCR